MKVKVIKFLTLITFVVLFFLVCVKLYEKSTNGKYENQYLFPKDLYNMTPIMINTSQECYRTTVKTGQNLSCIVEDILDEYLLAKGIPAGTEKINIANAIFNTVNQIKTRSDNSDLIYPGETLIVKLPKQFAIYRIDTIFEVRYYDVERLRKVLNSLHWIEPYKAGHWDCSNMSSFLSMWLIKQGWDAYMVSGQKYGGLHTWIQVKISPDKQKYVNVEATGLFIDNRSPKLTSRRYRPWEKIDDPLEYGWWHLDQPLLIRKKINK